ncbi:MAG: hypothetical protein OEU92_05655 [Alphaproteobacteria bacterium]|nr:hypothetical protein [Alphaproteobacteria bacterium]
MMWPTERGFDGVMRDKSQQLRKRLAKKAKRGFCGFPQATLAAYGPKSLGGWPETLPMVPYETLESLFDPPSRLACSSASRKAITSLVLAV